MFGKLEAQLGADEARLARVQGFNPRVRGTCLVSGARSKGWGLVCEALFQSPCAGNMFGKRRSP